MAWEFESPPGHQSACKGREILFAALLLYPALWPRPPPAGLFFLRRERAMEAKRSASGGMRRTPEKFFREKTARRKLPQGKFFPGKKSNERKISVNIKICFHGIMRKYAGACSSALVCRCDACLWRDIVFCRKSEIISDNHSIFLFYKN